MQALFIAFCIIAAIGGAHLSWWMTDGLITRFEVEPAHWIAQRWREYRTGPRDARAQPSGTPE